MDTVSVILPTYNRAPVLSRAINSVLRQSYEDVELLVVDDGSTDDTRTLMKFYDDDRIRYLRHDRNAGPSAARNTGIRKATGAYYVFLDSDDELLPHAIETLLERLHAGDHVAVTSSDAVMYRDGTIRDRVYPERTVTRDELAEPASRYRFGGTSGGIIEARVLEGMEPFDETLHLLEDHDLYLRLAKRHHLYCTSDVVSITHKENDDRLTTEANIYSHRADVRRFLEKHEGTLSANFLSEEYYRLGHFCAREGDRTTATTNFKRALAYRPLRPKYLLYFAATAASDRSYDLLRRGEAGYKHTREFLGGSISGDSGR